MNDRQFVEANVQLSRKPSEWAMFSFDWEGDESLQLVEMSEENQERFGCKYGLDDWAVEFLDYVGEQIRGNNFNHKDAVDSIQVATASGHGIGKSTLTAILILFIMCTRPGCKGVVTANTSDQLKTKTWGELGKWYKRLNVRHWFVYNSSKGNMNIFHKDHKEEWRVDAQTCREENSESFAGLHSASSTPFYIFDEASAVPDAIWEVAEGGLTDGEPMWFVFGNPTRNSGKFFECFNKARHRWKTYKIDSRSVRITNKSKLKQWEDDHGEHSDFFKIRVKGDFPENDGIHFMNHKAIDEAQERPAISHPHQPLIMGIDPGAGGGDKWVIRFRKGSDARGIPPIKMRNPDPMTFAGIVSKLMLGQDHRTHGQKVDMAFCDTGCGGWNLIKLIRAHGVEVTGVSFSNESLRADCLNKRAQMWKDLDDHMQEDLAIDSDKELITDLKAPEVRYDKDHKYQVESKKDMKKRGISSPDDADALALTYAQPVAPNNIQTAHTSMPSSKQEFDPFS